MDDGAENAVDGEVTVWRSVRRIMTRSGAAAGPFWLGLGLRILERCCELLPYLLAYLWLRTVLADPWPGFAWAAEPPALAAALAGVFGLQWLLAYHGQRLCFLGSYRIIQAYRAGLTDHVRKLPLGLLSSRRVGHLADLLTDDVNRVESIFTHVSADLVAALGLALTTIALLAWVDGRLAAALLCVVPVAVLALTLSRRVFERAGLRKHARYRESAGLLVEFVGGLATLRLYNRSGDWLQRLDRSFEALRRLSLDIEKWGGGPVTLYRLCVEGGLLCLLLACAWLARPADAAAVDWLLFFLLAYKFIGPLLEAAEYLLVLRYACQSEVKLDELWRTPALPEPAHAASTADHTVRFDHVSFAYDGAAALHDVSFTVPERTVTAIVGPSGAGKSSLLHLLARFYDPQQGRLSIGGLDLREIGSERLYGLLGMVFQQVQLFDGSIMDNVRVGCEQASDEAVLAACAAADCDAFVRRLPEGYRTRDGEGGMGLSGGERQRLSQARAQLKQAPLLLLDEVTAAVDAESQRAIQQAVNRLAAHCTVIMVAHRLQTVREADQIVVLDQGRVVELGTHERLLRAGGLYARMWAAQEASGEVPGGAACYGVGHPAGAQTMGDVV